MLCSGDRKQDCIQCMINRDSAVHDHQSMLSNSTSVSPEDEPIDNNWDVEEGAANIELTSEGEEEDEAGERTGEYVHLCVPLTAGCVQITVGHRCFPALVDTGASVSFINPKLVSALHADNYPMVISEIKDSVSLADNKVYEITHKVSMLIEIGGIKLSQSFLILSVLNRPVIMGLNFMRKHKAKISFSNTPTENKPYTIRAKTAFVIPPNSQHITRGYVMSLNDLVGTTYLTTDYTVDTGFGTCPALVSPLNDQQGHPTVPVSIVNSTEHPIEVRGGAILGCLATVRESDYGTHSLHCMKSENEELDEPLVPINCGEDPMESLPQPDEPLRHILARNLEEKQKLEMSTVVERNRKAFVTTDNVTGQGIDFKVRITLKDGAVPSSRKPYRTTL